MSLKPGSYAGALATFTNLAGRTNAVAGGDVSLKFKGSHQVSGFRAGVDHRRSRETDRSSGAAMQANYSFNSRRVNLSAQFEHYDELFAMDTAFLNRTGVTGAGSTSTTTSIPTRTSTPGSAASCRSRSSRRPRPGAGRRRVRQRHRCAVQLHTSGVLPRRHALLTGTVAGPRVRGQRAPDVRQRPVVPVAAHVQQHQLRRCDLLRRDRSVPGQVREPQRRRPLPAQRPVLRGRRSTHIAFDRPSTGERVYTLNIVNTRTTYQFSKEFALRAIVQYDSQQNRVLTDFLGSTNCVPARSSTPATGRSTRSATTRTTRGWKARGTT